MKKILATMCLLAAAAPISAQADNSRVNDAIARRPELSSFYQAMVNTGVIHELDQDRAYTVFAPTNDAFAKISTDRYPCFYSAQCRAEVADIVRNHIVPGEVYVSDASKQKGGLYTISNRFIPIGIQARNDYTVDGNNIIYASWFGNGIIYKIDGVIADPVELASVSAMKYAPVVAQTTVTRHTIPDPACGIAGCPDEVSQTTTYTRTISTMSPAAR